MFAAFLSTVCGSLLSICVTALSAFSVTIIFRTSTTANFAQGSIAAFGCYVVAECLNRWGVPVYLGVLPGMIVGVVIGLFIDLMVFRKGRHVGELGKQIITMGFVSLFYGGIPLVFGNPEFIPFESFYNTTKAGVESNVVLRAFGGEIVLTKHALICAAITAVVLAALFLLLKYTSVLKMLQLTHQCVRAGGGHGRENKVSAPNVLQHLPGGHFFAVVFFLISVHKRSFPCLAEFIGFCLF